LIGLLPRCLSLCLTMVFAVLVVFISTARAQDISVKAVVNYSRYEGSCPANLRFTGNIRVDLRVASYNYQWERSDGAKSELKVVRVSNGSSRVLVIHEDWQLGRPGRVWERLRVRTGNIDVSSEPANVTVECK